MVTAIILLNVERQKISETAETLIGLEGVSEVYSVSGSYDLIVMVRVPSNDQLSELVTRDLAKIDAIEKTETMLAFKTFSELDLETMFGVGM